MWKEYQEYMNHNISFKCSNITKQLLETQLTEKQILLLDKREKIFDFILFYCFFVGIIIGIGVCIGLIRYGIIGV